MGGETADEILRRFARDQWVRVHGTPRITVLVGAARARGMWERWLEVGGFQGKLYEGRLDDAARDAARRATAEPSLPTALLAGPAELTAWRRSRGDRLAAMIDEGIVRIADRPSRSRTREAAPSAASFDARSAAELAMFEALEATPATAGRFELNECLSVYFGGSAAEVDLLSRRDGIAIEIDGYHHFQDIEAYRRDRKKDLLLQLQGLIVIRLHAQDVMRDPRPGVTAVCQALAYRKEQRP